MLSIFILLIALAVYMGIVTYVLMEEKNKFYIVTAIIGTLPCVVIIMLLFTFKVSYIYILEDCRINGGCNDSKKVIKYLDTVDRNVLDNFYP